MNKYSVPKQIKKAIVHIYIYILQRKKTPILCRSVNRQRHLYIILPRYCITITLAGQRTLSTMLGLTQSALGRPHFTHDIPTLLARATISHFCLSFPFLSHYMACQSGSWSVKKVLFARRGFNKHFMFQTALNGANLVVVYLLVLYCHYCTARVKLNIERFMVC